MIRMKDERADIEKIEKARADKIAKAYERYAQAVMKQGRILERELRAIEDVYEDVYEEWPTAPATCWPAGRPARPSADIAARASGIDKDGAR